jgi:GTP-binding protein HflX
MNLSNLFTIPIMDKTQLIIEIFASHASTKEGKLQVELAHLQYMLPRQRGLGLIMSRLGGGIGTRGPGETKLEIKKRRIRERISKLKKEILKIGRYRNQRRGNYQDIPVPVVSLVGYTNAGKSTLLNKLTNSDIIAKDELFSTLDPTRRNVTLPSKQNVIFSDTVGFIQGLPHHLVHAFKSTLEEVKYSSLIIHLIDISDLHWQKKAEVVEDTLISLGCETKKRLVVLNKIDNFRGKLPNYNSGETITISAKNGKGFKTLLAKIDEELSDFRTIVSLDVPRIDDETLQFIYKYGSILKKVELEDKISFEISVEKRRIGRLSKYL